MNIRYDNIDYTAVIANCLPIIKGNQILVRKKSDGKIFFLEMDPASIEKFTRDAQENQGQASRKKVKYTNSDFGTSQTETGDFTEKIGEYIQTIEDESNAEMQGFTQDSDVEENNNFVEAQYLNEYSSNTVDNLTEEATSEVMDSFVWNERATFLLLEEYNKRKDKFRHPKIKKKALWQEIENTMKKFGYTVNIEILDRKFRNLKQTFKLKKDNDNKKKRTGTGRIDWKYFKLMDQIFENDVTVNTSFLMSSTLERTTKRATVVEIPEPLSPIINNSANEEEENTPRNINLPAYLAPMATPTTSLTTPNPNYKTTRQSRLDLHRKKIREIEEKRVAALNRLAKAVEDQNIILNEKNGLLKKLIENPNLRI